MQNKVLTLKDVVHQYSTLKDGPSNVNKRHRLGVLSDVAYTLHSKLYYCNRDLEPLS